VTKNKLKKTLPIIPFSDIPDIKDLPPEEQNKLRINALELFLKEYIVDVRYLDDIRESGATSLTSNSIQNSMENRIVITEGSEDFNKLDTNSMHSATDSTMRSQQQDLVNAEPNTNTNQPATN
jgi:hypothetical protein